MWGMTEIGDIEGGSPACDASHIDLSHSCVAVLFVSQNTAGSEGEKTLSGDLTDGYMNK